MSHSRRVVYAIIVCAWLSGCGAGGVPDNAVVVNQAGDGVANVVVAEPTPSLGAALVKPPTTPVPVVEQVEPVSGSVDAVTPAPTESSGGGSVTTPGPELLTFQVQLIAVDLRREHDQQPLIVNVDDVVSGDLLIESGIVR